MTTDACAGLSGVTVTEAELAQMLRNSLAGGDPKARAWQVEQEMWQERRAANTPGRGGPTLNDAQVASLRDAFSSRDPEAIAIAGRILANSFRDVTVRIGPDQEAIENRAFMNAALLLACEYGYACGENNTRVLNACAFQGHCGVASLPDYLFYYGSPPTTRSFSTATARSCARPWKPGTGRRITHRPREPVRPTCRRTCTRGRRVGR